MKSTRPTKPDPDWREKDRAKKARAARLPALIAKAKDDKPLFPKGEGDG